MSENYKFFQNNKCEYFPCHKVRDPKNFNCLFCFCPLYMLKDKCGGNFKYKNDIKDCSDCTIPHSKGGYDHIMSKMKEVIRIGSKKTED
ncbi:cysteine-rich small domain-containing protein [Tepidibacter sp. Z1-5]|uniref:cysteine-rich small domain-containing protein n=1 Tax=Tepidibacter sp. Z1-5 TaxID=3134138 RepID=UPI0030BFF62C